MGEKRVGEGGLEGHRVEMGGAISKGWIEDSSTEGTVMVDWESEDIVSGFLVRQEVYSFFDSGTWSRKAKHSGREKRYGYRQTLKKKNHLE